LIKKSGSEGPKTERVVAAMKEKNIDEGLDSRVCFERLEGWEWGRTKLNI
jgi:hypothetical protein